MKMARIAKFLGYAVFALMASPAGAAPASGLLGKATGKAGFQPKVRQTLVIPGFPLPT